MRKIDFEEWREQRSSVFATRMKTEKSFQGRAPGRRPRDPEKERVLSRLDKARWEQYIASGKLEVLGPRRWRLNFDKPGSE